MSTGLNGDKNEPSAAGRIQAWSLSKEDCTVEKIQAVESARTGTRVIQTASQIES